MVKNLYVKDAGKKLMNKEGKKMNLKKSILKNSGVLNEMAAKELGQVVDLINADKLDDAVKKYIEIGGNPKGITKTVNSYLTKNPDANKEKFNRFREAVNKTISKDVPTETRAYNKSKTGVTKEGEKIEAGGQSAEAHNKSVLNTLHKHLQEIQTEKSIINNKEPIGLKLVAKEILDDLKHEKEEEIDKDKIEILTKFLKDGSNTEEAISAMKEVLDAGEKSLGTMAQVVAGYKRIKPTEEKQQKLADIYKKIKEMKKKKFPEKVAREEEKIKKKEDEEMPEIPDWEDNKEPDGDPDKLGDSKYWTDPKDENKWKDHTTLGTSDSGYASKFGDLSRFKNLETGVERIKKVKRSKK